MGIEIPNFLYAVTFDYCICHQLFRTSDPLFDKINEYFQIKDSEGNNKYQEAEVCIMNLNDDFIKGYCTFVNNGTHYSSFSQCD